MSKGLKIVLGVAVVVVAVIATVPFLVDADQFRPLLEREARKALGRQVTIGKLRLSVFKGQVGADQIVIGDDPAFSKDPFIQAAGFNMGIQVMPLIREKKLIIESVDLSEPQVSLVQSADLRWNFASLGGEAKEGGTKTAPAAGEPIDATVKLLRLTKGRLTIRQAGGKPGGLVIDRLELEASNLSTTTQMPVKLTGALPGGGKFALDGAAGPMAQGDAMMTPVEAKLNVEKLDLAQAAAAGVTAVIGGVANYAGTLSSKSGIARLRGQLTVGGLTVGDNAKPAGRPIELSYNLTHNLRAHSGVIERAALRAGKAEARFGGQYSSQGAQTTVGMALEGNALPLDEIVSLLPAFGVVLPQGATLQGGSLSVTSKSQGVAPRIVSTGTITLVDSRLTGYSLGSAMTKAAALAGIKVGQDTPIERLQADFENSPQSTKLSNILLIVPELGKLTGAVSVDAAQNLDGQLTADIKSSGGLTGAGLQKIGGSGEMSLAIPISIRGTTSQPQIIADKKAVAGQAAATAAKSAVEKYVPGNAGKAASSILGGFLSGKKKKE